MRLLLIICLAGFFSAQGLSEDPTGNGAVAALSAAEKTRLQEKLKKTEEEKKNQTDEEKKQRLQKQIDLLTKQLAENEASLLGSSKTNQAINTSETPIWSVEQDTDYRAEPAPNSSDTNTQSSGGETLPRAEELVRRNPNLDRAGVSRTSEKPGSLSQVHDDNTGAAYQGRVRGDGFTAAEKATYNGKTYSNPKAINNNTAVEYASADGSKLQVEGTYDSADNSILLNGGVTEINANANPYEMTRATVAEMGTGGVVNSAASRVAKAPSANTPSLQASARTTNEVAPGTTFLRTPVAFPDNRRKLMESALK